MKIQYITFSLLLCCIHSFTMQKNEYKFQKFQNLKSREQAAQKVYREEMLHLKKDMITKEYYFFKVYYNECPIDSNNNKPRYFNLCSSCNKVFNHISVGTQRYLNTEKALNESLNYSAKL